MNSNNNNNYSQFIEHSFRRITRLIHEQNDIDTLTSTTNDKTTEKSFDESSLRNHPKSDINKKKFESIDRMVKVEPVFKAHRSYMRPPKNRTTITYRCSSSQSIDRPETSSDQLENTLPTTPPVSKPKTYELPIYMPRERTAYDVIFERDRENDIREKYNIPLPFQRKWLREPRYVPQERPIIGQTHQSKSA